MKLNKYIPVAALSLMLLNSGCSDSFWEKSPSDYITSGDLEEVAKWNTNILMGQALGTYSTTFAMSTGDVTNPTGYKLRVFSSFYHPRHPIKRSIGIASANTLDKG